MVKKPKSQQRIFPFRLIRLIVTLLLLSLAVVCAVRLIAMRQPSPLAVLFTNPDGTPCEMPCMLGVKLGVTKFADVVAIIQAHPLTNNFVVYLQPPNYKPTDVSNGFMILANKTDTLSVRTDTNGVYVAAIQLDYSLRAEADFRPSLPPSYYLPERRPALDMLWHSATLGQFVAYFKDAPILYFGRYNNWLSFGQRSVMIDYLALGDVSVKNGGINGQVHSIGLPILRPELGVDWTGFKH